MKVVHSSRHSSPEERKEIGMDKRNLGKTLLCTLIAIFLWNVVDCRNFALAQVQELVLETNLKLLEDINTIDFDRNLLAIEPIASYSRDDSNGGAREDLKFSSDGTFVAIGGMEVGRKNEDGHLRTSKGGRIELWHVESGKQTVLSDSIRTGIDPTFFPVTFSADSKQLAAADTYGVIKIWDLSQSSIAEPRVLQFKCKGGYTMIATSICFTPDGKRIFVGADSVQQLDIITGQEVVFYDKYAGSLLEPTVIDCSSDGKLIAFGGVDRALNLLNCESATIREAFESGNPFKQIFFHQFLSSGKFHLTAGEKFRRSLVVTELSSRRITAAISTGGTVAMSADGSLLAIENARIKNTDAFQQWWKAYRDEDSSRRFPTMISLWKIEDGKPEFLAQFRDSSDELVRAMAISPDGNTLVTSGAHLRFWDISEVRRRVAIPR